MPQISRRTVAQGSAWSIPAVVVASSAPALAASTPCSPVTSTFDFANWTRDQAFVSGGGTYYSGRETVSLANGTPLTITGTHSSPTASLSGSQDLIGTSSGRVPSGTDSLTNPLMIQTFGSQNGYTGSPQTSTLTLTFSQPLQNLQFTISDIDTGTGQTYPWQDIVTLSSGYTIVSQSTSVTGSGPFTGTAVNVNNTGTTAQSAITVSYTNVSSITVTFQNGSNRLGAQNFYLGNFKVVTCA